MSKEPIVIERKVQAAARGMGTGGIIGGFIVWLLDEYVWSTSDMPVQVVALIMWAVPSIVGLISAYLARHTHRPEAS